MSYATITVEGGLFPPDLLDRIATEDNSISGQKSSDFCLSAGRRLPDEIQRTFSDARVHWDSFTRRLEHSRESRTTLTRQDWGAKFFELLSFPPLEYQRTAIEAGGTSFSISYLTGGTERSTPVHIVAVDQGLDHRPGRGRTPHALVQDYLNRSEALWGIVTNGVKLRLLRDSSRLSKPTYLEFDIQAMMEGNAYSEFVALYRLLHATRLPRSGIEPHECLLESYYNQGIEEGGRVREKLRDGVRSALETLGSALVQHPDSEPLREALSGRLTETAYYRQLLNFVYRMLFLMVTEERRLLFTSGDARQQAVYDRYYSIAHLRGRAEQYFYGDTHSDLWAGLAQTFLLFRDYNAAQQLGLSPLNGELFGRDACQDIEGASCTNEDFLRAMLSLSTFDDNGVRRRVNYAHLDVEEFGSVYESLLDYRPVVDFGGASGARPRFQLAVGTERKQTGSYYTPPELVRELVESALIPVMEERLAEAKTAKEQEQALLALRVCDPASGSGHFLLAAARRIARELARVRSGGDEPAPSEYRGALRDVVRSCLYAVDKNPLAVDLCKVALWIESHAVGLPLSFLDDRIKCGDSLVGIIDPTALHEGIPDDAYKAVTGDDKQAAIYYRRRNRQERTGQRGMDLGGGQSLPAALAKDFAPLRQLNDRSPEEVQEKENLYQRLRDPGTKWWEFKTACDMWTYAFFAPVQMPGPDNLDSVPTTDDVRKSLHLPASVNGKLVGQASQATSEMSFFHWPLECPEVFQDGGFDVVLGNPPWGQKQIEGEQLVSKFVRGTYSSAAGTFDWFRLFVERGLLLLRNRGRFGLVLPDTILLKNYESTRRYLLEQTAIESITWWGAVFSAATIDATTIAGTLNSAEDEHKVHVAVLDPLHPLNHTILQREFWLNQRLTFNLFLTPEKRKEIETLEQFPKLGEFFEIHEGVHSGNMRSQLFVPGNIDDSCRPLIARGREISPYRLDWSGTYIRLDAVPERKTREAYANLGKLHWYDQDKILVQRTGDRIIAAVDRDNRFASNNFFVVFPSKTSALDLDGLCALLNSMPMTWYFRTIEPREGRVFAELKIKHLEQFPLPLSNDGSPSNENGLNRLNILGRERNKLANVSLQTSDPTAKYEYGQKIDDLDREIDSLSQQLLSIEVGSPTEIDASSKTGNK